MPKLTVAAFKRAITTGCVLEVVQHRHPVLLGRRTVICVNTTGFYLRLPQDHPRYAQTPEGSFVAWPRASGLDTGEDGAILLTYPGWEAPLMRFTITDAAATAASATAVTQHQPG